MTGAPPVMARTQKLAPAWKTSSTSGFSPPSAVARIPATNSSTTSSPALLQKSRTAREERFEKEQADRRAEAEKKAKDEAEARAQNERERVAALDLALEKAVTAKKAAEELINFMQYDLSGRLKKVGHLDMMDAVNARVRKYHEEHPPEASDLDAIREESVSFDQHGDVQSAQGDLAGALKSYRDSLAIREKLSKQDPGNAEWQRDLSVGYNNVGKVQSAQGDLAGALKSFNDALAITEELLQQNSSNFGWQSDLSDWYAEIGKVLRDQGDFVGALKNYRDSLGIREKLAIRDPSDVGWQGALGWIYWQTGAVLKKVQPGSIEEGLAMVEKGRNILRELKGRTGLTAEQQKWLREIEADLRNVRGTR